MNQTDALLPRPPRPYGIEDGLHFLLRKKWQILIAVLIPACVGLALAFQVRPKFEADGRLLVLLGPEYLVRPMAADAAAWAAPDQKAVSKAEIEILSSEPVRLQAAQKIGLSRLAPEKKADEGGGLIARAVAFCRGTFDAALALVRSPANDPANNPAPGAQSAGPVPQSPEARAAAALSAGLMIEPIKDSNVIRITYRHGDPKLASEVVNTLIESYLARRAEVLTRALSPDIAGQQLRLQDDLKAAEAALKS